MNSSVGLVKVYEYFNNSDSGTYFKYFNKNHSVGIVFQMLLLKNYRLYCFPILSLFEIAARVLVVW